MADATKKVAPAPTPAVEKFISEGVAVEIEQTGSAVDPATGKVLSRSDLPARRK